MPKAAAGMTSHDTQIISDETEQCHLLQLPAEIRCLIYDYYFKVPELEPHTERNGSSTTIAQLAEHKEIMLNRARFLWFNTSILRETSPLFIAVLNGRVNALEVAQQKARAQEAKENSSSMDSKWWDIIMALLRGHIWTAKYLLAVFDIEKEVRHRLCQERDA